MLLGCPWIGGQKVQCRLQEERRLGRSVGQHACFRAGLGLLPCFLWKAVAFGEVPAGMTWRCARVCG